MFKKLIQKVEGNESPEKDGSVSPAQSRRQSVPVRARGKQRWTGSSSLQRTESTNSLSGSEADMPIESSTKEDLVTALMQRTTQVKRLEIKLADYSQSLKECTKERDKLITTLEKQQDTAMRRMSELEETYTEGKIQMENRIASLDKKEADLIHTVEKLRTKNKKLKVLVEEWKNQKEEFEKKRDEFYAKRDNSEELNDLQMQEMAKVKHMLMNREKECKKYQIDLDEKIAELIQCRETNDAMEVSLREVTESLNSTNKQLEIQIETNENLSARLDSSERETFKLRTDLAEAKEKLQALTTDFRKTRSSLSALESIHSGVCEKYQSLKHSSEAVMKKATSELDAKESIIEHLKKKISSLEQRITTDNLPENEQVQALISERSSLENRLEESHQQLNNIKQTWSTKINQLEQQVSHLNAKIVEDCEEIKLKSEKYTQLESSTTKQIEDLKSKLNELQHEHEQNLKQTDVYLQQSTKLEADIIEQSAKYELERSKLKQNTEKITMNARTTEAKLQEELDQLQKSHEDAEKQIQGLETELAQKGTELSDMESTYLERVREFEKELENKLIEISNRDRISEEMARALEEIRHSRDDLREKCERLESLWNENEKKLHETTENLNTVTKESEEHQHNLSKTQKEFEETRSKLEEVTSEMETMKNRLSDKDTEMTSFHNTYDKTKATAEELTEKVEEMTVTLQSREKELMKCKTEIADLRNNHAEDSDEVLTLKEEKKMFEDKLADRERSIKLQQQRLNDLKKALNKELSKRNPGSAHGSRSPSSGRKRESQQTNGLGANPLINGSSDTVSDLAALGTTSIDDPSLSLEQREVTVKYLKHVILTFLSCGQSEAQQLIKAMSMLLSFNKDEEKFVKDILEYRTSWFGSKPSTKKVVKSSVRQGRR